MGNRIHVGLTNGCSCGSVEDLETKKVSTWGVLNHQPSDPCRMPDICCPMYLNTGSGDIDIFQVNLIFEISTVSGQQHSFRITTCCSSECVENLETENVSA